MRLSFVQGVCASEQVNERGNERASVVSGGSERVSEEMNERANIRPKERTKGEIRGYPTTAVVGWS